MMRIPATVRAFAPAKVNLGLEVIRHRPDGYHEIETLFQALDFGDDLEFSMSSESNGLELHVEGDYQEIGPRNVVERVYERLREAFPAQATGLTVKLIKRVPIGAGLGGGSSDAAATLLALNRLWGLELAETRLQELALEMGSDVPFFLKGGTAIGRGRGERLDPVGPLRRGAFLLVNPGFSVSTAWAYNQLKMGLTRNLYRISVEQVKAYLSRFPSPGMVIRNRLEDVIFPAFPVMGEIAEALKQGGAVHAVMSGSGATVFGTFPDCPSAERARVEMGDTWQCWVACPLPSGIRID